MTQDDHAVHCHHYVDGTAPCNCWLRTRIVLLNLILGTGIFIVFLELPTLLILWLWS